MTITAPAGRVLGSLVEKQLTTSQQYPLTINALSLACTQATNRDPVVTMGDADVSLALDELREARLVRFVLPTTGRTATRYRHVLDEVYALEPGALALLAVLLLRGPQTAGELRGRTARMTEFSGLDDVEAQLKRLAGEPPALVQLVVRRPGQKEERWRQLLAEEWATNSGSVGDAERDVLVPNSPRASRDDERTSIPVSSTAPREVDTGDGDRALRRDLDVLRAEVMSLRTSVDELSEAVAELRGRETTPA